MGIAIGAGMSVLGWLLFRDNPEQCGLVMDGRNDPEWVEKMSRNKAKTVKEFTRSEAIKTVAFWGFSLMLGWQALFMTAVTFHITSLGAEAGLNRQQSYAVFPIIGFITLFITLGGGWLSDKIKLKKILIADSVFMITATVGLLMFSSFGGRTLFCFGYGFAGGLFGLLLTVSWPRYFGRKHVGALNGLTSSILVFASAIGPILFSGLRDLTGSFKAVIILSIILPSLLLWIVFKVRNPQSLLKEQIEKENS